MFNLSHFKCALIVKLNNLINELERREPIAEWALSIIDDDDVYIPDEILWSVLTAMGSVDVLTERGDYLYNKIDFESWLKQLQSH